MERPRRERRVRTLLAGAHAALAGVLALPQLEERMHIHHGPIAH